MRNLFERLPIDSEVYAEAGEITPEARRWNIHTYMLANILDGINYVAWSVQQSAAGKRQVKRPKPYKRPQLTKPKPKKWPGRTISVPRANENKEGNANG